MVVDNKQTVISKNIIHTRHCVKSIAVFEHTPVLYLRPRLLADLCIFALLSAVLHTAFYGSHIFCVGLAGKLFGSLRGVFLDNFAVIGYTALKVGILFRASDFQRVHLNASDFFYFPLCGIQNRSAV